MVIRGAPGAGVAGAPLLPAYRPPLNATDPAFQVKFALLPDGEQPDTVDFEYLRELLSLR